MANITLNIVNITIMDNGNYSVQVKQISNNETYIVVLTAAQCVDLPTMTTAIQTLAQPLKFIGQNITIVV